ncbi:hypothetical protein MYIN104542_11410 [Mycobacterium intermedium]
MGLTEVPGDIFSGGNGGVGGPGGQQGLSISSRICFGMT